VSSRKRVFLINQYFYPDLAATSQLLSDLAESLAAKGWDVTAITGRGSYSNRGKTKDTATFWKAVFVRRVWCTNFGRGNLVGRLSDYLTFLLSGAVTVALAPKADVVICLSTPPFVALLGLIARMKGSRLIYKVEDLYPDIAVALSTLKQRSLVTQFFSRVSSLLLRKADCVVALDKAMTERLQTAGALVDTIPNWADGAAIRPDSHAGQSFRKTHGLEGRFVVLYSGNAGLAHRFDAVMEAAIRCANEVPAVLFLFVGSGARLNEIREAATGLKNVRFMDYQPRETLNELYNAADIHLVTLRDEVSGMLFPSKYPAALAAGKPVLLVGAQSAPFAREIQTNRLGWSCPHASCMVVRALQSAIKNPEMLNTMGRAARHVFMSRYSKTLAIQRWEQLLELVLKNKVEIGDDAVFNKKKAVSFRSL
jgi:putative colanic acid biosynthesis glycosyltransferase WcaI